MKFLLMKPVLLLAVMGMAFPTHAAVTFTFNYTDPAGEGFNAAGTLGMQRRGALDLAGQNFATAFSSYNANIIIDASQISSSAPADALMGAASASGGPIANGFGLNEVVRNKVLSNGATDLNATDADGEVSVNFSQPWLLDVNATPTISQFDWYSTAYHELSHAMGFASSIFTTDGSGGVDQSGENPGAWNKFDQFLSDMDGNSVFSGNTLDQTTYASLVTGGTSPGAGLFFDTLAGGADIEYGLFSPSPSFESGSSGSHLDTDNPALAGSMLLHATSEGPGTRIFSTIEQNIFKDIGYTLVGQITAIPEPTSMILLVLGFAGMATGIRRQRS